MDLNELTRHRTDLMCLSKLLQDVHAIPTYRLHEKTLKDI